MGVGVVSTAVGGEDDAAVGFFVAMAGDAVLIEDGLDMLGVVDDVGEVGKGCDLTGRASGGEEGGGDGGGLCTLFVATDAGGGFAGHDAGPALHAFDGEVVFVECDEVELSIGGQFEIGGSIGFDGDGAEDALECEGAEEGEGFGSAGEIDGFWEGFEDEDFFDVAGFDAGHVSADVCVGEDEAAGRFVESCSIGDD